MDTPVDRHSEHDEPGDETPPASLDAETPSEGPEATWSDEGATATATSVAVHPGNSRVWAQGLTKAYRNRKVVDDVDIEVSQGDIVGLLGPNGAGKTTTFYMMVGLIQPDAGTVHLDDEELTRTPMYQRARRGLGYLAQEPSIFRKLSVEDNVLAILETLGLPSSRGEGSVWKNCSPSWGSPGSGRARPIPCPAGSAGAWKSPGRWSSGPSSCCSTSPSRASIRSPCTTSRRSSAELKGRGIGVVISDHNVEQTLDIVDRAYIMYEGRIRVSGTVTELVWNDEVAEIYLGPALTARMRQRYPRPGA